MSEILDYKKVPLPKDDEVLVVTYKCDNHTKSEIYELCTHIKSYLEDTLNSKPNVLFIPDCIDMSVCGSDELRRRLQTVINQLDNK